MIKYKRIGIIFGVLALIQVFLYLFLEMRLVNGLLAGYLAGIVNFYAIVLTVKKLLADSEQTPVAGAVKAVFVYLGKLIIIGVIIGVLVIYRQLYSIKGFLIGFTITLVIIGIEGLLIKKK